MISRQSSFLFSVVIALLGCLFAAAPASAQYGYPGLQYGPSYGHAGPRYYRSAPVTYGRAPVYGYNQTQYYGQVSGYEEADEGYSPPARYQPYYPSSRGYYRSAPRPRYAARPASVPVRSTRYVTVMKPVTRVVAVQSYRQVTTWRPVAVRKTVVRYKPVTVYRRIGY